MRRRTAVVPPLQVITGKGGVGKSSVAAALATAAARAGHEVLAIEMGGPGGMAGLFGVAPPEAHGVPVAVRPRIHLAFYEGEAALNEYLLGRLPLRALVSGLFTHPLYRAFVAAGPGVRELMAIGKVRDELLGLSTGGPLWDLIVVDAGASGHALQLLGMPAAAARTFSSGLAHREANRVASTFSDAAETAIHVVALPEEMPLLEAAETIERLRDELHLPVGRLIVNQCRQAPPPGAAAALEIVRGRADPACRSLAAVAANALGWLRLQEDGVAALERRVGLRAERLPRLAAEAFGPAEIEALAVELAGSVR